MRFVIATLPDVKFNLGRDLHLVKACALYGDKAVLFSPTYCGTEPFLDFSSRPLLHQLVYLALLRRDPGFVVGEKLTPDERAQRIRRATERSSKLFAKASAVIRTLEEGASGDDPRAELRQIALEIRPLVRAIETVWCDEEDFVRRARELAKAEKMGLVTIQNIHETPGLYYSQLDLKTNVGRELARADSYGALDERFVADFHQLSKGQAAKVCAARVGETVLQGLPGFSEATLEEIRDIRHELGAYLAGFRKAVLTISRQIESEPWSADFPHDVERALRLHVEPAVAQIKEEVRANSYLQDIVLRVGQNPLFLPASSAFGLLLSSATHVPALIGQVVSGVAGAGLLAVQAHNAWKSKRRVTEANELFFYYRAADALSSRAARGHPPNKLLQPTAARALPKKPGSRHG